MEIRIAVSELLKALHTVQGVVQRKNTMPILSNILLETDTVEGKLHLTATDLDVGIRLSKNCEVIHTGQITVSAKALFDIVKVLPGPDITLKLLDNQQLHIKSGRTNAKLLAISADEFPKLPSVVGTEFHSISASAFSALIEKTLYCTSQDENRYNLTGVYFEPQKEHANQVVFVSTDGHRLSRIQTTFEHIDYRNQTPVILPRKGLSELMRLLADETSSGNANFELGFQANQAIVKYQQAILTMRLIDGKFPDYNQVIPKLADKLLRCSRIDFLTSLKRVSVLATDKNQCVKLQLKNGEATVACVNPEAGEVTDDVPVEYRGPDLEIGFNVRYVIEALSSLEDANIVMKLTDPLSPTLLIGIGQEHHICVVMPMRI